MAAAAAAAAARRVPLRASPPAPASPETAKAPASVPTSSAASASPPLRAAVAPSSGRRLPAPPLRCSSSSSETSVPPSIGLLVEVEGVLADVYRFGNRQAFNVAFQSLGLDCANWTEPIYTDLVRCVLSSLASSITCPASPSTLARGDEERMLALFFDRIGWPTSLPTSEKGSFMKSVLREKLKALEEFSASGSLPLRPGVETFIDDALSQGIPVAILAAYGRNGENISRSIVKKLGPERTSKIKIVGKDEVEGSFYGQLVLGKGVTSSLDEQLIREAQKAASAEKQRIAEEVASILKLSVDITVSESHHCQL
ncbi:CBBY-like protein isoform X3 [Setaria italica]|uniref:CBBY-like protein isoform X3 n=1 Tax=Setaria italica TaxID=4555 RepID=UPI000BE5A07D|nr:CBBY-like protein isoform X3 [Setaria italica]XP_034588124.1 CBBY-like protein isoform X3 [Setaria viridis]